MNRRPLPMLALLLVAAVPALAAELNVASLVQPTMKGGFKFSDPSALPSKALGLLPEQEEPIDAPCGPDYASQPMAIGDRDRYAKLQGMAKGAGMGLLSKALSSATGGAVQSGGGKQAEEHHPPLHEDPIPKKLKTKLKDRASGTDLRMGGRLASDGILLSTRLDDVRGKGTVQEIYLERDDCRRIYPYADYAYELWGKWSLSVSWTRTSSTYQDGKLIDRQTSSGGFMRSGDGFLDAATSELAFRDAMKSVPPELHGPVGKYQAMLQNEAGPPMWERLGFAAPSSGARAVGNLFKLSPADLEALGAGRYHAIVQVTREHGPFYQAVGVPVTMGIGEEEQLTFAAQAKKSR